MKAFFFAILIAVSGASAAELDQQAALFMKNNQFGLARLRLLQVARESRVSSRSLAARHQAALCLIKMKDYDKFRLDAAALKKQYPQASRGIQESLQYNLALADMGQQRWTTARDAFRLFALDHPQSKHAIDSHFKAADCLMGMQAYDAFRAEVLDLARRYPSAPQLANLQFSVANSYYKQERYPEARELCQKYIADYPKGEKVAPARGTAAQCLYQLKQYASYKKEANAYLKQNSKLSREEREKILLQVATASTQLEQWRDAADLSKAVLDGKPSSQRNQFRSMLMHIQACHRLATAPHVSADAQAQAQLKLRESKMLQAFRTAALKAAMDAGNVISTATQEVQSMFLESYYHVEDYSELEDAGKKVAAQAPAGSRLWALGQLWRGVAKASRTPADLKGAAALLDEILAARVVDSNTKEHVPTRVASWRAVVAQRQGDQAALERTIRLVREQMPAGPLKNSFLARYDPPVNPPDPEKQ